MKPNASRVRRICGIALFFWWGAAGAYWIGLQPAQTVQPLNGVFALDLVMTGLKTDGQILSTYDVDISFNLAMLALLGAQSGSALGAGSIFISTPGVGLVNLFELSMLSDASLAGLQGDVLTLATLTFSAIGAGTSMVEVSDLLALGGSQILNPITGQLETFDLLGIAHTVGFGEVTVTAAPVPEPGTLALVVAGLLFAAFATRRRR